VQRLFHVPTGADHAVEIDPTRLEAVRDDGWVWLDVAGYTTAELLAIGTRFGLDRYALEETLRESPYPTVEAYDEYTFVIGHGIAADAERVRLVETEAFIGVDFLVTLRREDLPGFDWGHDHATTPGALAAATPDRLFSRLAEAGVSRFRPLISALDDRILELEDQAIDGHPSVPLEIQALRRDLTTLRKATHPQREVYRVLGTGDSTAIGRRASLRLGAVHEQFERLTEEIDLARGLLGGVLDTHRSTVAERANEVMKVLTVFAAIVLPLSLMAGIYGMNFANIPELQWEWGYFGLLGLMATVGLGLWIYFARRGFIGGPKLSAIPRGVGRGLAGLVGLTVKPTLRLLHLVQEEEEPPSF
jgi:magnesium transporter